jgi:hypothetical protein
MIYVRSFLAGLAALIILAALIVAVFFLAPPVMEMPTPSSQGDAGWYFGAFAFPTWPVPIGALVIFAAVSYWTYKRLSRASDPGLNRSRV